MFKDRRTAALAAGGNSARPDQPRVWAISETILVRLTADTGKPGAVQHWILQRSDRILRPNINDFITITLQAFRPHEFWIIQVKWFHALGRPHLDLTLSVPHGLTTRIVSRPGVTLSQEEREVLIDQLRSIARKVLPDGDLTYGVLSGSHERLDQSVITLVCNSATGEPIAFNALALIDATLDGEPLQITHLGLVMVDPEQRGQGLSWVLYGLTTLLMFLRNGMRPFWISNVTQVPAVVGMVAETFSEVFPSPMPQSRQSFSHLQLARQIMAQHRHVFGVGAEAGFDEARSIITNAYTGGSDDLKKRFEDAAPHREPRYNDFCRQELDYERGDDVLQLGRIDLAGAQRYVLKQVPRASLPQLLGTAAFLFVQRLVLPLVHWLDDSRRFGPLRPHPGARQ